ncbi:MAG TPA: hypothetical protein PLH19_12040 [Anaerolineae bacterium]|nr:hypothetical protein [Anaerolineae bacterium]HQH39248.1 hypothetical protein [Anaerolineae bacterium]
MSLSYITYELQNGYIHHWLVAGPQTITLDNPDLSSDANAKLRLIRRYDTAASGITRQPVEPGPLSQAEFTVGNDTVRWAYTVCAEDHFVDGDSLLAFTDPDSVSSYARAWAYTELKTAQPGPVQLLLTTYGPTDVWVNDVPCYHRAAFGFQQAAFTVNLAEGHNGVLVHFEQIRTGEYPHAMALRVDDAPDDMRVQIPTLIEDVNSRNKLERLFATAYLDRDVFVWDEFVTVHWAVGQDAPEEIIIRLQTPSGHIYAESLATATPGDKSTLVQAHQAPQGPLRIIMMPPIKLYYDENVRIRRMFTLWGMGLARYNETPEGDDAQRRMEALHHASRCEGDLFAEAAKMALGMWNAIELPVLLQHIECINRRTANSALYLLGLLGMLRRWGNAPTFPKALKAPLKACALNFVYPEAPRDAAAESEQLLLYTCEILAGQLYPQRRFKHSGQTGEWHVAQGKRQALAWLHARARGGFAEWDAGPAFEIELTALAHLMDLVESEAIWEMATVIMDKLLFTIALNSFHGVLGGTQGRADAAGLFGGWLAPLGGVTRLLWGVGILNPHLAAPVSLACMEDYELPPLIQEIATAAPDELWNREQHLLSPVENVHEECNASPGADSEAAITPSPIAQSSINKVSYRTPDYLLGSAQDYRPGTPGTREHIWQATLGPGAVVFTNHPARSGTTEAHVPGFWRGNGVLPRVAQWKDVLIAVYHLPDDDWMGFTHAYFPISAFDAYAIQEDAHGHPWAFARKGAGYLALTAAQGFTLMTTGPGAYRELRSPGLHHVWLCQMGRAALDGEFEAFQDSVLTLPVTFDALAVTFATLRHETLAFGWEGPLLRDGQPEPLSNFKHYENPYCSVDLHAPQMEIKSANYLMRLKFAAD